jgi:signal transduction histidine kinase
MMKKGRLFNFILGAGQSLLIAAIFVVLIFVVTHISVPYENESNKYNFTMDIWEEERSFEDSSLFYNIFSVKMREIIRHAVISMQMETNGIFDPNKMINVTDYIYRRDTQATETLNGDFTLSDLLTWGEDGLSQSQVIMDLEDFLTYFDRRALTPAYYYVDDDGNLAYRGRSVENSDEKTMANLMYVYDLMSYRDRLLLAYKSIESNLEEKVKLVDREGALAVTFPALTRLDDQNGSQEEAYQFAQSDTAAGGVILVEEKGIEDQDEGTAAIDAPMESLFDADAQVITDAIHIEEMKDRYPIIDNIPGLLDSVDNWSDYLKLQYNLQIAVSELWSNYQEYSYYTKEDLLANNMKYMLKSDYFYTGNIPGTHTFWNETQVEEYYTNEFTWYVTYPQNYAKFTGNDKWYPLLGSVAKDYRYAFNGDNKIWIAVDTNYPNTNDIFYQAKATYSFLQYREPIIILLLLLLVAWIFLTVLIGIRTIKRPIEQISLLDHIWTELLLAMGALLVLGGMFFAQFITQTIIDRDYAPLTREHLRLLAGLAGILYNLVFYAFFKGLLLHGKHKALWKRSLIGQVAHWSVRSVYKCAQKVSESKNDMVRTLVPYAAFLLVNLLGVAVAFSLAGYRYIQIGIFRLGLEGFLVGVVLLAFDVGVGVRLATAASKRRTILNGIRRIREGELSYQIDTVDYRGENKELAESFNLIGEGIRKAVENSIKDERLKTELITNVSHDIKTPLTSIINYVDLLKREGEFKEPIKGYLEILDAKSQRLKQLTDDLVEASKISSGNLVLNFERLDFGELLNQALGEYAEKLEEKQLPVLFSEPNEAAVIYADSRRMWRVIENLLQNICKYAMPQTRVYLHLWQEGSKIWMSLKNISLQPLNISAAELTERFIRGDDSRTTEGSGLGLSIAKSLTEAQGGTFTIQLDGDLFKVLMSFDVCDHS